MKKLLILLMLLPVMAGANDLQADLTHTIVGADTTATNSVIDTAESSVHSIAGARYVQFFSEVELLGTTAIFNRTDDTIFVDLLTSADQTTWIVHEIDTFLAVGSSWSPLNIDADATVFGNWAKARVIYQSDALAADEPDSIGNVRGLRLKLWYILK